MLRTHNVFLAAVGLELSGVLFKRAEVQAQLVGLVADVSSCMKGS